MAGCGWFTRVVVLAVLIGAAPRVSAQTPSMHDMPASDPASAPSRLAWSGFADTVWQKGNEPGEPNTFSLGQFTLYPTATLADNLSMLAEIVAEVGNGRTSIPDTDDVQNLQDDNTHKAFNVALADAPAGRQTLSLGGLRFDFAQLAAVKAEFRYHDVTGTSGFNAFAANVSFTF